MNRFVAFGLLWLCSLAVSPAALALSQESMEHARSAFVFADRHDWSSALEHARYTGEPALINLITWEYLLDQDSGASFDEVSAFLKLHSDWPEQKRLRLRAEMALRSSNASAQEIINWFKDETPISGIGKIALADALMDSPNPPADKITMLVRDGWRGGDFDESQEREIVITHRGLLRQEDHIARGSRLLWEEKTTPATRMLPLVPTSYQTLFKARMALIDRKKKALSAVLAVSKELQNDPGLIYDRMRYRAKKNDNPGVREMLLKAPKEVPFAEKWWKIREMQIREAISEKKYIVAGKLLANHGQSNGKELSEAVWLSGWLKLEFENHPKEAYQEFYKMYDIVRYPVSRARAAFWAARAAERSGDKESAENWYHTAASYPTTFYGQLAAWKSFGSAPLHIPAEPAIDEGEARRFDRSDVAQAIELCVKLNELALASQLASALVEQTANSDDGAIAADLGNRLGQPYLSVRGAKKAAQQNVILVRTGYPRFKTPDGISVERPLALAIIRQESEFDAFARSPSNALGMMQLLPGTAKENARKLDMDYSQAQLFEPEYNITLGTYYLSRMIDGYSGSYVMAIAAYNAGPGNVRIWANEFGTPGTSVDSAVNWIEKIPFAETRNYVQRVIENLQIYRHLEAGNNPPTLKIDEDLTR